jgi:hypothetical protein
MVAVRSYRGTIYCKVSDVDEASVSYIDEWIVEAQKACVFDGSRYVRDNTTPRKFPQ